MRYLPRPSHQYRLLYPAEQEPSLSYHLDMPSSEQCGHTTVIVMKEREKERGGEIDFEY